jgi:hypothetical protein
VRGVTTLLSLFAMGAVVLYVIFTLVAGIDPAEAALATTVAGALAVLLLARGMRREYEFRSQGGDPALRSSYNAQRERRGF